MVKPVFDELTGDELVAAAAAAADGGLSSARQIAATRLVEGPVTGAGRPAAVVKLLMERDDADPRWERLQPFEQRWSLLVVRIVAPVMDPVWAVRDARRRGLSWAAIGAALGVTAQTAHGRFAARMTN